MSKLDSLQISNNQKHGLTSAIFDAITNDIPELIMENELPTTNGVGLFRWNYVNKNILKNIGTDFKISVQKRGPWKFLILYDKATGFTFSVMSEQNLQRLQKSPPNGMHYLEALSSVNTGYEPIEGQIVLSGCEVHRDQELIEELRNQLLMDFNDIVKNHILVLFDYSFNTVTSVRAVLLTPKLEIAFSESMSQYLGKPYLVSGRTLINEIVSENNEAIVSLKKSPHHDPDVLDVSVKTVERENIS